MEQFKTKKNPLFRYIYVTLETLFLGLTGIYLFYSTTEITTFHLNWPDGFEDTLLIVMAVPVCEALHREGVHIAVETCLGILLSLQKLVERGLAVVG